MRRVYADVSDFRAPFDAPTLTLTGLGATAVERPSYRVIPKFAPLPRVGAGLGETMTVFGSETQLALLKGVGIGFFAGALVGAFGYAAIRRFS